MGENGYFEMNNSINYSKEKGYGHIELSVGNIKFDGEYLPVSETDSVVALKNGGWNVRRLVAKSGCNEINSAAEANTECSDEKGNIPSRDVDVYRIDVPGEGTYKVELTLFAGKEKLENVSLFAGRRNLIDYGIGIEAGEEYSKVFYQAVTPYIPPLCSEPVIDKSIFISIAGLSSFKNSSKSGQSEENAKISVKITKEDVPVIWVAGDSTLTDQNAGVPYYPYGSCAGWAQTLQRFIKNAAVCNLAHSGMTTNCFRDDGHLNIVKEMIKPGDLFVMQFGHNDQKRRNLGAFKGYAENLRRYIKEVRALGAEAIICSPISRIPAEGYSLLSSYAKAAKLVADEMDVSFADLHQRTFEKWSEDIDAAHDFFMPGDITHTNEYGALLISGYFMEEMRKNLGAGSKIFEQLYNHIDRLLILPKADTKDLPKELPGPDIFRIRPPYVDIKEIPEYDGIKKAFRYALLDPCVMHLHPYAPIPRAQLLMLLFRAFGKTGERPYKGHFKDVFFDEWDSGYIQALETLNIVSPKIEGDDISDQKTDLFRPDDMLTYEEFADFIMKFVGLCPELQGNSFSALNAEKLSNMGKNRNESAIVNVKEPYGVAKKNEIMRHEVYTYLANIMEMRGQASKKLPADSEMHPVH